MQVKQDDILKSFGAIMQGFVNPTKQGEMAEGLLEIIFDKSGIPEDLYDTQKTSNEVRPDVIVSLPGNSKLIVDSKCVTNKYFDRKKYKYNFLYFRHISSYFATFLYFTQIAILWIFYC